jgi:hypothetical protein
MNTCGMYISGKTVRIVTLEGTKEKHDRIVEDGMCQADLDTLVV